ncbi:tudor domain-containing protein 1-like isoform X2 [Pomacea canaliculata]|uniref:tudor domain-containing protein 1-like isoform X2 n=1 Tax=Pomacea canaliculata TaxID=400727 RepID=UPI000D732288|nr:tudor domain-containing protein 1-like isoform X2 [Pomacea canaliculata]
MCKQCFDKVHKMSFSFQRHQALPFFAVSEERLAETKTRSRTCLVHEQCQIEYFCKEDNEAICSRCVIVGDHKGHDVQTMEDKNKDTLIYMEPAIQVAQETLWRLNKAEKSLTDVHPFARRDTKELEEQLRTHFQELHSLIQAREQQLLDEIKTASTSIGDITQEMKAFICEKKCMLQEAIQDGLQTLQGSIRRLVDADLVLERLEHAKNMPCVLTQDGEGCVNNHIRFLHGEFQPLKESILKYGSISVTSSQMFELRLPGPDDEKPPLEERYLPNVSDVDSLSFTESESLADSASVILEEEKEELCGAEEVKPKMAVYPSLKPMIPGHNEQVQVTHICTPGQFFVQQLSKVGELAMLSQQLNSYCRSFASKKDPIGVLVPGDRVLAQFSKDKKWYRAIVNNIVLAEESNKEEDSFIVFFIDYGNCEITTMKSLRKAHKNFFKAPSFALECALHDISPSDEEGWSRESVEMMLQMTVSGPMIMTVFSQAGNVLEVDLSCPEIDKNFSDDRPVSVRDSLVFLEAAIFKSGSSAAANPGRIKRDFLTLPRFLDGKLLDIIVTCANTPQSIYAQHTTSTESYLHHLEQRMLELYSQESEGLYTVFCPRKGMICAAQYSQDKMWYRARILDILGGRRLLVQYVDYGNTEIIHHTKIRKILDDDIKFPEQAIECCLSDVEPADGNNEWSEEARAWISRQVLLKVCQFRVTTDSTKSNSVSGVLYAIDVNSGRLVCINSELVKHGFASSTGKWSQPPKPETFEGVTLTPQEQRNLLQLTVGKLPNATVMMQVPEKDKTVSKTQKSPVHLSPGPRSSPSPNVYTQVVSSCSTHASKKGRGVSSDQRASKKVETYRSNGVLLQQSGTSPGQQSLPTSLTDEKPSIHSVAVRIAEYQSPGHFYIQLQDKSRQLDSLMTEMSEYNSADQMDREWKVGDYCAARYSKDQSWYRGRVRRNLEDGSFEVFLVDYGFTDIISRSQLRLLLKKHGENECFAERCHLAGIQSAGSSDPSKWTSTAREFMMKQITQGKQLFVKLEGEAVPELGLPVDIVVEEIVPETAFDPAFKKYVSLIDLLLGQGLALPIKGKKRSSAAADTGSGNPEQCFQAKVTVSASSPVMTVHESNSHDSLEPETVVLIQPDFDVAPHPPPSASAMVVVPVYVDHCGVIFAHDVTEEEMLTKLIQNMDQYAQQEAPKGCLEVKPGQFV